MFKKLLILLFVLVSYNSISQIKYDIKTKFQHHSDFNPIIEEFIAEGKERGFYLRGYLIENIDTIFYYDVETSVMDENNLGVTIDNRYIYINGNLKDNPLLLKIATFHELGHALNKSEYHVCYSCVDIMGENYLDNFEVLFTDKEIWEGVLDRYFKWLNEE